MFHGYEAKRKVASFGYDYDFNDRSISKSNTIPQDFQNIVTRVSQEIGLISSEIEELLVTQYHAGSVINWHRDAPPFKLIAGISLKSDCIFKLRPYAKAAQTRKATLSFNVQASSLYIIQDEARTDFEHCIAPVKKERYSLTFRTLNK